MLAVEEVKDLVLMDLADQVVVEVEERLLLVMEHQEQVVEEEDIV